MRDMTPEELCTHWRALDYRFETLPNSPLHHDQRCTYHLEDGYHA
jgi:hypothetical protein